MFDGYDVDEEGGGIDFHYTIKSQAQLLEFTEKLIFPNTDFSKTPQGLLERLLQNLSLVLGISYWKLYCPKKIEIANFSLTKEQADFWNDIYTKGLGEFFYRNKIDFRGLVAFPYIDSPLGSPFGHPRGVWEPRDRSLLMLGGGKDSIVAAELLKERKKDFTTFVVNDYTIQKEIIKLLGVDSIIVQREIDPKLLELNTQPGTYNGHVPISAIYAFSALLAAAVYDYRYVISSNEASANYGNVEYLGETINHQWSKSLEFEKKFAEYVKKYLTSNVYYFSLLRPLYEIKIAQLFSKYPKYFSTFSSCNRNFTIHPGGVHSATPGVLRSDSPGVLRNRWCGQCPKCAFVFATLAAFLSKEEVVKIFGKNLFADALLTDTYKELLGIKDIKPFECVGIPDEVKLAFYLAHKKGEFNKDVIIQMFEKDVLPKMTNVEELKKELLSGEYIHFNNVHH